MPVRRTAAGLNSTIMVLGSRLRSISRDPRQHQPFGALDVDLHEANLGFAIAEVIVQRDGLDLDGRCPSRVFEDAMAAPFVSCMCSVIEPRRSDRALGSTVTLRR